MRQYRFWLWKEFWEAARTLKNKALRHLKPKGQNRAHWELNVYIVELSGLGMQGILKSCETSGHCLLLVAGTCCSSSHLLETWNYNACHMLALTMVRAQFGSSQYKYHEPLVYGF